MTALAESTVVWQDGLVEEERSTAFGNLALLTRRIAGTREQRGGTLFCYVPKVAPSGEGILEYRSFDFDNPNNPSDRRRPVYGLTASGDVVPLGMMYLAGRSDAGHSRGRRWGQCR